MSSPYCCKPGGLSTICGNAETPWCHPDADTRGKAAFLGFISLLFFSQQQRAHLSLDLPPIIPGERRALDSPFKQMVLKLQKDIFIRMWAAQAKPLQTSDKPLMAFVLVCVQSLGSTYALRVILWVFMLAGNPYVVWFANASQTFLKNLSAVLSACHSSIILPLIKINISRLLMTQHSNRRRRLRFKVTR